MEDPGRVLFEYIPLPMSPMTLASLLLLAVVTLAVGPLLLPSDLWPLGGLCFAPLAFAAAWALLQRPGPTRIRTDGIDVSLPLWRRLLGADPHIPWVRVRNVFPAAYEVSGAALSPFASSAGTLVHTGLGLELADGRRRTVKFTPGAIRAFRGETPGFAYAMAATRRAFEGLGRPLVSDARRYTDEEVRAMHEEARRPLLGMGTIVVAFLLPPTLVALVLVVLNAVRVVPAAPVVAAALVLAALPPAASMAHTLRRSRRRNELLGELAKHEELLRAAGPRG